jgi:hypothetical protein
VPGSVLYATAGFQQAFFAQQHGAGRRRPLRQVGRHRVRLPMSIDGDSLHAGHHEVV